MPVVDTPVLASAPAPSDPNRIPVNTHVFSKAITDPRRSCGARHWINALSGTKISALDVPRTTMSVNVAAKPGAVRPTTASIMATPAAPSGIKPYSTRALDRRPTHRAPTPIPIDSIMSGRPDCQSETRSTAFA